MTKNVATALVAGLLFPLHERLKGHDTVARLRALERSQWLSTEEIEARQAEALRAFLVTVARDVPYYRKLFAEYGFNPLHVRTPADLSALPLLDKSRIRANRDAMIARTARRLKRYNTGGSSGEPLVFYVGRARVSHDVAAKWRATRWWGVDVGDREIVVWGSPIELGAQDRLRALRDRAFRTTLLPAFEMSDANLDRFVDKIRAARPRMLFGYPSAIAHIARHARSRGRRMDDLSIRVAFVTSERLYDDQKSVIESVFACRTANGYGGRDAGFIAHECPRGGMHVSAEDIVVEIVDSEGRPVASGDSGEIVVTHLATGEFPFVRYRTGDIGTLDPTPCACGRGLPLLMEISGRTTDFVVARDGTIMHGLALIYTVRDLPGIEQFRIVQHDLDRTEVQLVASPAFTRAHEQQIVHDFRARLGTGVDVRITRVEHLGPEASGKFRYVVSHVRAPAVSAETQPA